MPTNRQPAMARFARRCATVPLVVLMLASLTGCEVTTAGAVYGLVEGSSLNQTGKTASDHLISTVTGDDCNLLRYQKTGKYCLTSAKVLSASKVRSRLNTETRSPGKGTLELLHAPRASVASSPSSVVRIILRQAILCWP